MTDSEYRKMYEKSPDRAQTALFDEYLKYVYAIVYNKLRSCGSREDIEECVGDTFSAVFISYDREGKFNGDLKGFIGAVANRQAIQMFRRLSSKAGNTVYIDDETAEIPDGESSVDKAERSERRSILLRLIKSLGEPESTMVIQKYYYNMNSTEIAQKHKMTPAVVRVKCSRALKKLKALLSEEGYDLKEGNV